MKIIKIEKIPTEMLKSKNRKVMWKNTEILLKKLKRTFPISKVYVCGSFTTKKKWPNDVDIIILFKVKNNEKERWSADIEFVSNPNQAQEILKAIDKYMGKRYGPKNAKIFELKSW
jgi:hypothetical protein